MKKNVFEGYFGRKDFLVVITIFVSFLLAAPALYGANSGGNQGPFSDVQSNSPFSTPLQYLKDRSFVSGYDDGTFAPDTLISRAEALAMIFKATGVNADSEEDAGGYRKPFADVFRRNWFFPIVVAAKKHEIISGYNDGRYFKPRDPINLAEALRMLFKSAAVSVAPGTSSAAASADAATPSLPNAAFAAPLPPGIPQDAWYAADIAYAVSRSLVTQQTDGGIFSPARNLSRGELALLIYRFLRTRENAFFGYASWYGDGLARTRLQTGLEYTDRFLTAAHRSLPFETIVRVTNMQNGRYVDVVINDRGPFVTGRIIDLSRTAFSSIASAGSGVAPVQIEPIEIR